MFLPVAKSKECCVLEVFFDVKQEPGSRGESRAEAPGCWLPAVSEQAASAQGFQSRLSVAAC